MATLDGQAFSASTDGKQIAIPATSTPGTLVHTAGAGSGTAADHDEVYMYLHNNSAAAVEATIEWGADSANDQEVVSIPSKAGRQLVIPGLPLQNSLTVRVFAPATIYASGMIHRIDK